MLKSFLAWTKAHARQIVTIVLWGGAMYGAHHWPAHTADAELVASALALAVGIQLPPFRLSVQSLTKLVGGVIVVLSLIFAVRALSACDAPKGTFDATTKAAASLAVDFSQCVETDFLALANAGSLSKDAAFASAEKCGISNIKDGVTLLVAAFNDVKHYLLAKHSPVDAGAEAASSE
jgi:hypothetical protein